MALIMYLCHNCRSVGVTGSLVLYQQTVFNIFYVDLKLHDLKSHAVAHPLPCYDCVNMMTT